MATSGEYTITVTAQDLIKSAMRIIGVVASGEAPDADELKDARQALNFIILQLKGPPNYVKPGQMMWTRERTDLTLTAKAVFDLKPSGGDCDIQVPVEIITATRKDTDGNETPLTPITLEQYESLSRKNSTGTPGKFYYEKRTDVGKLYLDYIPSDITDVIDIVYRQPLELLTSNTDDFDIEDFWYRALKWNLAVEIAPEYGVTPSQLVLAKAAESLSIANTFYPENVNICFEPGRE